MLTSKEDYFKVSKENGLPGRCPIYDRCERKAHSIAVANDTDRAAECKDLTLPSVPIVGEGPYQISGNNNFLVGGICPEVPLFESNNFIIGLNTTPTTKGQYDKYMTPKYEVLETGHFSQCAEFSREILKLESFVSQEKPTSWFAKNYQWCLPFVVGTALSFVALYYAYLSAPHH